MVLNAATLGSLAAVQAIDAKEFARLLTLNIAAPQALIAAFDSMLRASSDARVVALTSSVGTTPRAYWGAYAASKAALEAMANSYKEEVANTNISVKLFNPGSVATKMWAASHPGQDQSKLTQPKDVAAQIVDLLD